MGKAVFIISLDTESIWGYHAYPFHKDIDMLIRDNTNGRGSINNLLNVFEKYNIPATWAIVGHLFLERCKKRDGIPHKDMPPFRDNWYFIDPCTDIQKDPLFYGKDIIESVLSNQIEHEIGCHSFSHVQFSKCSYKVAEAEIKKCVEIAKKYGIVLQSFVFPENMIGHINVLKKYGFEIYRGKNVGRYDLNQRLLFRKFNGALDKLIASPIEPKWMDGIWEIPSSMYFCDPQIKSSVLPRAKLGLYRAIKSKKVFHIFLHPQDLLKYPSLICDLDKFLGIVAKKRDEGDLEVMTMGNYANIINEDGAIDF
jgi:peptidoglycan/xylan/chitin deacetylase (PgdA/CDA1 family)